MFIGYARGTPYDNTISLQKDALTKAGCGRIYTDALSDAKAQRKELEKALSPLRPGDMFVVWRLDRLGTSIKELLTTMSVLYERGIGFQSLGDNIDTTTREGMQVFRIFRALRYVMKEKTTAGRWVARAKGRKGGRPKLLTALQLQELRALYNNQEIPITEIRRKFHLSRSTFYRYVQDRGSEKPHFKGLFRKLTGRR
jgi:DNA invertase Pin-like site-specific DNA recombinase